MSLNPAMIERFGDELFAALSSRKTIDPLSEREPGIDIDDAYRISQRLLERRLSQGDTVIGKKIGVTSEAVQQMLDVHQPDFGFLLDTMRYANASRVSLSASNLIQPKVEGEIAFVLNKDLKGPDVTEDDVLDATEYVCPCFEIVDSRIRDWNIKIQDTVADNASCGIFVLGAEQVDPRRLDLAAAEMHIARNGEHTATGFGSAVQGHPATAVAWLANTLGEYDIPFLAGEIILSGSLAPLLPVAPGDEYTMNIAGVGTAAVSFTE